MGRLGRRLEQVGGESLIKPNNRGAQLAAAARAERARAERFECSIAGLAAPQAARAAQAAVDFQDARTPRRLVQPVDVLGDQGEAIAEALLQFREGEVPRVGSDGGDAGAAGIVELPDQIGVAGEPGGRGHVLDAVPLPQAVGGAEGGDARFGRNARAGEDRDAPRPAQ